MYWWNYRKLALALREGTVKPWQYAVYYTVFGLGVFLSFFLLFKNIAHMETASLSGAASILLQVIAIILSIGITYRTNQRGDKKDYWKRMAALNFPITIRFLVLIFPLLIVAGIVLTSLNLPAAQSACEATRDIDAHSACLRSYFAEHRDLKAMHALQLLTAIFVLYWGWRGFRIASGVEVPA